MERESIARETGWLIESGAPWFATKAHWLRIWINSGRPSITWTDDPNAALRFARKEDATYFWYLHPEEANIPKITEHVWMDGMHTADGERR